MRQSHKVVKHTQTRLALKELKYNYQVSKEMQSWPAVYLFFFFAGQELLQGRCAKFAN